MKLSALMMVAIEAKGPRRPKVIMDNASDLGRSVGPDRFIFQWPQCNDMKCGRTDAVEIAKAKARGCLAHDEGKPYLEGDSGMIQYPVEGAGDYENGDKCIWQIKAETPNKFIKFKIVEMNLEYDQYCGLDKLHIYRETPDKFGGREDDNDNR